MNNETCLCRLSQPPSASLLLLFTIFLMFSFSTVFFFPSVYLVLWIGLIHFLCWAVKAHFAPCCCSVCYDAVFILFSQHFIEIKKIWKYWGSLLYWVSWISLFCLTAIWEKIVRRGMWIWFVGLRVERKFITGWWLRILE